MQEINQNFPSVVASLSRMKVNDSIKDEILANQRMVPPGKSLMALNGALINIEDIDLYRLFDLVHQGLSFADQFSKVKIPEHTIRRLLSTSPPSESSTLRIDFRSSHVHYLNNLEEDSMYKRWRSNVNEILMPTFPGQLRYIRKNLFHAVYIIDPATTSGLEAIDMIMNLYENQFPMRFGVILYSTTFIESFEKNGGDINVSASASSAEEDISSMIIRLFIYIKDHHGVKTAFKFLSNIHSESGDLGEEAPEKHHVEGAFIDALLPKSKSPPQDVLLKLEQEKPSEDVAHDSSRFVFKLGLANRKCCLLLNGLVYNSNEEALVSAVNDELPRIQEQVYYGNIDSHTDVLDKFLLESGVSRYNPQIISDAKSKPKFVSLAKSILDEGSALHEISYLHSPESSDNVKPVTQLLAIDLTTMKGMKLLREGIRYLLDGSTKARVGVLFSPSMATDSPAFLFVKIFQVTTSLYSHKQEVLKFLDELCSLYEHDYLQKSSSQTEIMKAFIEKVSDLADAHKLPSRNYQSLMMESSVVDLQNHLNKVALFLRKHLGHDSSLNAVITNGRVTGLVEENTLLSYDLHLLESLEFKQRIKHISEIIEGLKWEDVDPDSLTSKFISDIIMLVSSSMSTRDRSGEAARFEILHATYSAVVLKPENSSIHIDAVIDPLSASGQKLTSLLRILWKSFQPSMRIVLNPLSSLVDLPLKNYYRYVVPTMDDFGSSDYAVNGPKAFFANMPLSKTLTMNLDVPEMWLVEPVIAVHDLDNILLENLGETRTLQAVFELEALVLTGHCFEKDQEPPRGLQMILGTKSAPHLVDTLVMANLGYWQMKVSPGIWYLQLAPGRSSELYLLKEDDGGSQRTTSSKRIIIDDLCGKVVHLEVEKRKGKEHEKLLVSADDDDQSHERKKDSESSWNKNLFKWASGLIGGGQQPKKTDSTELDSKTGRHGTPINIFSIASGHLKFINLQVIFVDADQVVRADMGELYDMDIKGKPLAYTPFCDNNKDMDGYRFWRQPSYVKRSSCSALYVVDLVKFRQTAAGDTLRVFYETLSKDPNSLSNLDQASYPATSEAYSLDKFWFVRISGGVCTSVENSVDLAPNYLLESLDLPNYAQHTVPIFSLPQEWLWCESWCGNATKPRAKTIDLCNNPMTKEPKLQVLLSEILFSIAVVGLLGYGFGFTFRFGNYLKFFFHLLYLLSDLQGARRIIAEWTDLDLEARRFTARILGEEMDPLEQPAPPPQAQSKKIEHASSQIDMESKAEL
ncbi:hypothetical protein Cgig2_020918 [Carnegiea gigantea]|uniref:UDP-glucose:glycoprotein glucosyltransferase n=1 Tax=Carnegiea gigantea TaxID=171969 RepID=A0A9Q1JN90_9CARY|nr:hypothetical protein Cgig2_020918 [Carnegiea gigantea]